MTDKPLRALLAVDLNDDDRAAVVAEAGRWAARMHARVDLVFAEPSWLRGELLADPNFRRAFEAQAGKMRDGHRAQLAELLVTLPEENRGAVDLIQGQPVDAIVAKSAGYDALFVASRQRTGLAHLWLGSVAEQLVRRCLITVIVVRVP